MLHAYEMYIYRKLCHAHKIMALIVKYIVTCKKKSLFIDSGDQTRALLVAYST